LFKIQYNKRSKRYVVFEVPEKGGLWHIKTVFKSRSGAEDYIKAQKS
jgi:hypothetical protein